MQNKRAAPHKVLLGAVDLNINPAPQKRPTGAFLGAGTGCSNLPFYCSIKSMQNKRAAPHKVLLGAKKRDLNSLRFASLETPHRGVSRAGHGLFESALYCSIKSMQNKKSSTP